MSRTTVRSKHIISERGLTFPCLTHLTKACSAEDMLQRKCRPFSPHRTGIPHGAKSGSRLPKARNELGLPVTAAQIEQLKRNTDDIDFARVAEIEKQTRHDVMAHIRAYGEKMPRCCGDNPSRSNKLLCHRQRGYHPYPPGVCTYKGTSL